jgi:Fic family protein
VFSLSHAITEDKHAYYQALMSAQRTLDVSDGIAWFTRLTRLTLRALEHANDHVHFALAATSFWDAHGPHLNERQHKAIHRMLRAGPEGFQGGMNARKYVAITGTSKATATRDLQALVEKGLFQPIGSGRSTRYELVMDG